MKTKVNNSILAGICLIGAYGCMYAPGQQDGLPVLGRTQIVQNTVNGKTVYDTIPHTVADFSFVDQDNHPVNNQTFKDRIYVADFFFTSCPTICPIMKTQMLRVYEKFQDNPQVALLSHTIDPEYDNVLVLRDYANRLEVGSGKWYFVTGEKEKIYEIGQNSYMVTADEDASAPGGYIHSGAFLLVDNERRIRGVYDGTKEDQVDKLMADIGKLLDEYAL